MGAKRWMRLVLIGAAVLALVSSLWLGVPPRLAAGYSFTAAPFPQPEAFTQQKVTSADGAAKDGFGYSVAVSDDGSTALVGSYYVEFGIVYPLGPGDVVVYTHSGANWVFQAKLPLPPMPESDEFGYSLALSSNGSTALVGAKGADVGANENQGAAWVFTRSGSTWSQQAELKAADGAGADRFGISVALADNGSTAIVGAYVDDVGSNADQGSAYVFTRSGSTWTQQKQLNSADGTAGDYFGSSVGLSGDGNTAIVGARMDTVGGNARQGSAYIFKRSGSTWSQQAQLLAAEGGGYHWLGASVAISTDGNTALAGAEGWNENQGAAFVFARSGSAWSQQARLTALDGEGSDFFGGAVALSADGNTAVAGVHWDLVNSVMTGSAYVFKRSGAAWAQAARLTAADGAAGADFGISVGVSGDGTSILVGADLATVGANPKQGAAYFFTYTPDVSHSVFLPTVRR